MMHRCYPGKRHLCPPTAQLAGTSCCPRCCTQALRPRREGRRVREYDHSGAATNSIGCSRRSNSRSVVLTSASVHDSQVAIPLATMSTRGSRVDYESTRTRPTTRSITEQSRHLGHVPIVDPKEAPGGPKSPATIPVHAKPAAGTDLGPTGEAHRADHGGASEPRGLKDELSEGGTRCESTKDGAPGCSACLR